MSDPAAIAKQAAAHAAAELVENGMKLGLGTGSTAVFFVRRLAERVRDEGLSLTCVSTSEATTALAEELGIAVSSLDDALSLELTIDGADELDDQLDLIKGGGGALFREKIVATASERMIVIADEAKHVQTLGAFKLPIEVSPFGVKSTIHLVEAVLEQFELGGRAITQRAKADDHFITDQGAYIFDLDLGAIVEPAALDSALKAVPGVIETGLFIAIADAAIIGAADGSTRVLERDS